MTDEEIIQQAIDIIAEKCSKTGVTDNYDAYRYHLADGLREAINKKRETKVASIVAPLQKKINDILKKKFKLVKFDENDLSRQVAGHSIEGENQKLYQIYLVSDNVALVVRRYSEDRAEVEIDLHIKDITDCIWGLVYCRENYDTNNLIQDIIKSAEDDIKNNTIDIKIAKKEIDARKKILEALK